jgi:uncharacterized protein YeaO (DUF488 family)
MSHRLRRTVWDEFQRRYKQELQARERLVQKIVRRASRGPVTLVYAARDEAHNDAVVLAEAVRARMRRAKRVARGRSAQRSIRRTRRR